MPDVFLGWVSGVIFVAKQSLVKLYQQSDYLLRCLWTGPEGT